MRLSADEIDFAVSERLISLVGGRHQHQRCIETFRAQEAERASGEHGEI